MPTVRTVQDTGDTAALLVLDDGSKPIWTPDRELARTLLGKPIPADWLVKPNKQGTGNIALPPKKGGGGGGYRQSKEAFESEAKSRAAWQAVEEEKKDRRTALMQAVAIADEDDPGGIIVVAELMYDWLRESSPAAGPGVATPGAATTETAESPQAGGSTSGPVAAGRSSAPEASDGAPDRSSGRDPGSDTSPAASGEVAAAEPGEGAVKTSPGSTNWPVDSIACAANDHRNNRRQQKWVQVAPDFTERCALCGTPKISAVEGTTADLGAA